MVLKQVTAVLKIKKSAEGANHIKEQIRENRGNYRRTFRRIPKALDNPLRAVKQENGRYGFVVEIEEGGKPYYAIVEDLHSIPEYINEPGKKTPKDETGIWISLPGKVRFSLAYGEKTLKTLEFSASQFGEIENLNEPLFSKKVNTTLLLHPYNGGIEKIESVQIR